MIRISGMTLLHWNGKKTSVKVAEPVWPSPFTTLHYCDTGLSRAKISLQLEARISYTARFTDRFARCAC